MWPPALIMNSMKTLKKIKSNNVPCTLRFDVDVEEILFFDGAITYFFSSWTRQVHEFEQLLFCYCLQTVLIDDICHEVIKLSDM